MRARCEGPGAILIAPVGEKAADGPRRGVVTVPVGALGESVGTVGATRIGPVGRTRLDWLEEVERWWRWLAPVPGTTRIGFDVAKGGTAVEAWWRVCTLVW